MPRLALVIKTVFSAICIKFPFRSVGLIETDVAVNELEVAPFGTSILVGQRNGAGEHAIWIKTTLQPFKPRAVAAVGIPGLFSIMGPQLVGVAAG